MSRTAVFVSAAMIASTSLGIASLSRSSGPSPVPYPAGYRAWTHLKSMAIVSDVHPLFSSFGGIHHVYANPPAASAARAGKPYPDGSVLVFDLLEAKESNGAYGEGARKFIGVMRKDRRAYAATGGWGFEGFQGDTRDQRMVTDAAQQCFNCHVSQESNDFVFSTFRK